MASGTINFSIIQPRMMRLKQAADYCGLPPKKFPGVSGIEPVAIGGVRLWDKQDCDRWLDAQKGECADSDDALLARLD